MFSIVTVASSTRMPTASARPPSVMMFSVSPSADSAMIEPRIASGIEVAMITVERQLPEEQQDHQAGQRRGDHALARPRRRSPPFTNSDWSPSSAIFRFGGSGRFSLGEPLP